MDDSAGSPQIRQATATILRRERRPTDATRGHLRLPFDNCRLRAGIVSA
jgi:hypothetical protein